jgi:bifunctional DNA-binding transcriptional regulator/antitoxin component of YhaV-PrlF toxin-antitoxin module
MASETTIKISEGGRIVMPAEYRKQLGLEIEDELIMRGEQGELKLRTRQQAIRLARASEPVCAQRTFVIG